MLIDICMKFRKDSLNGFQVIVQTRLRKDFVIDKVPSEKNSKSTNARVIVFALCMLSNVD